MRSNEIVFNIIIIYYSRNPTRPNQGPAVSPNKDIYETGEDMWFKAYLMDRQTLALSRLSTVRGSWVPRRSTSE
ncbi:hypothetical protein [Prevotella sp. khp7]|uniref:hypothetical protein n=1 Tax=Prevotella sp. khp7 TaxID=1761885 RepID=UPI00115FF291|nr:hypothetical protein [Prevotella sp. khp7]